jgi:NIPSNAP
MTFPANRWFAAALLVVAGFAAGSLVTVRTAAAAGNRVFEMRTYHTFEGRLPALEKRFREHTMEIFERHGMKNVGYWIPQDAPAHSNTLVYIISHESRDAAKANWAAFMADPEWKKVSAESQVDGKIVEKSESVFMDPTDYSPLK